MTPVTPKPLPRGAFIPSGGPGGCKPQQQVWLLPLPSLHIYSQCSSLTSLSWLLTLLLCARHFRGKAGVFGGGGGGGTDAAGLAADPHSSTQTLGRAPWLPIQHPPSTLSAPGQQDTGNAASSLPGVPNPPGAEAYVNVWV